MPILKSEKTDSLTIPETTLTSWQAIVTLMARIFDVPAGLIMRVSASDIGVLIASETEGNPYHPGDCEYMPGSGLYCEKVIRTRRELLVPNALADEEWSRNPDIKLQMISYLGLPILLPDGKPFGTICVLDRKENAYSENFRSLLGLFRDQIQNELSLFHMNQLLGDENMSLRDYIAEIQTLRGILPICGYCKKIRDDDGFWQSVEKYVTDHSEVKFSHSLCPDCKAKHYPEYK